ncbi:hypothetical protein GCM10023350_39290 [Nocardioides endophyticus]|uniref:Alpha/beta hydrolase fold-3 domain-containing protein n=1 Tax=Nocardioides endophyticus TaxID=1353775 RepID=A0ABP8Z9I4_9ACTN
MTDELWIDPELAVALDAIMWDERPHATIDLDRPERARARLRAAVEPPDRRPVRSVLIDLPRTDGTHLGLRMHRPEVLEGRDAPVLVWVHGGGYVLGSAAGDGRVERELADRVGCCVVGVDYRVAPEHPHPEPIQDVLQAVDWVGRSPDVDPARVALGGESAGAGLVAAAALALQSRPGTELCFQLLIAPMLDDRTDGSTMPGVDSLGLWNSRLNRRAWELYLPAGRASSVPEAVAARAERLAGLPATYLDVGNADLFCPETVTYAARLLASGVPVELHVWAGAYHGFYEVAPDAAISRTAKEHRITALRRGLGITAASDPRPASDDPPPRRR